MQPRDQVLDEAEKLKLEIERHNHEISQLERFANTVSTANKLDALQSIEIGATQCHGRSSSAATGNRHIVHLQKEIDILKLSSESFRLRYESEKKARESLQLKYQDLEFLLTNLRQERSVHDLKTLKIAEDLERAREDISELQQLTHQAEHTRAQKDIDKRTYEANLQLIDNKLLLEQHKHQQVNCQLEVLTANYISLKRVAIDEVRRLSDQLSVLKEDYRDQCRQNSIAQEEIVLFNVRHNKEVNEVMRLVETQRSVMKEEIDSLRAILREACGPAPESL